MESALELPVLTSTCPGCSKVGHRREVLYLAIRDTSTYIQLFATGQVAKILILLLRDHWLLLQQLPNHTQ